MNIQNQFGPTSEYSRSLESFYVSSSVSVSRVENRSAVFLNVAIIAVLLALIGFSGVGVDVAVPWVGPAAGQGR